VANKWFGVFPSICGFLMVGCSGSDPNTFPNSIKQVTKTWSIHADAFGRMMKAEKNMDRLEADRKDLVNKIKKLQAQTGSIRVPSGKEAQNLWNAFLMYLRNQDKIVSDDFRELVTIRTDPNPDLVRYREILGRCQILEKEDSDRLRQAEAAYATANGTTP